jgi:hypothetical protein
MGTRSETEANAKDLNFVHHAVRGTTSRTASRSSGRGSMALARRLRRGRHAEIAATALASPLVEMLALVADVC